MINMYSPIWNKYRPAILKLMVDAKGEPQQYQLSSHEFKALNPRQKGGYGFNLVVNNSKAVSGLKESLVAQDLWEMIKISPKASSLVSDASFQFTLDKEFKLTITHLQEAEV